MNGKKKIIFIFLLLLSFICLVTKGIEEIIKDGNFKIILEELDGSSKKESILKVIFLNRESFKKPDYEYFLRSLITKDGIVEIYLSFFKKNQIKENEYIIFLKYFKDKNDKNLYYDYIVRFSDEKNLDYKKMSAQFAAENILEDLYGLLPDPNRLKIYIAARLLYKTGKDEFSKYISKSGKEYILDIFKSGILSMQNKILVLKNVKNKNVIGNKLSDDIFKISFYDFKTDYTDFFKNSKYEFSYKNFRKVFKGEEVYLSKEDSFFYPLTLLFFNGFSDLKIFLEKDKMLDPERKIYVSFLLNLFLSDEEKSLDNLIKLLSSGVDDFVKLSAVEIYLVSKKINDGKFLQYYLMGDKENMKPFIKGVGKNSIFYYEMLVEKKKFDEVKFFKSKNFENEALMTQILVYDIKNGIVDRDDIENFLKKYQKSPFKNLFIKYL